VGRFVITGSLRKVVTKSETCFLINTSRFIVCFCGAGVGVAGVDVAGAGVVGVAGVDDEVGVGEVGVGVAGVEAGVGGVGVEGVGVGSEEGFEDGVVGSGDMGNWGCGSMRQFAVPRLARSPTAPGSHKCFSRPWNTSRSPSSK
jgi:hypothetical protein